MSNLEKFKKRCKLYAGGSGAAGILLTVAQVVTYAQYLSALRSYTKYPNTYDMPAPTDTTALIVLIAICIVGVVVAVSAIVAANLLIAYRKDVGQQ